MRELEQQHPGGNARQSATPDPTLLLDRLAALTLPKLLLTVDDLVAVGFGRRRFVWALAIGERLPQPIRLGARELVWPSDELRAWLLAGALRRSEWSKVRPCYLRLDGTVGRQRET